MRTKLFFMLVAVLFALPASVFAGAVSIAVPNAGFEIYQHAADGGSVWLMPTRDLWYTYEVKSNGGVNVVTNPSDASHFPDGLAPEGNMMCRSYTTTSTTESQHRGIAQLLDETFDPNTTYTLTVQVGNAYGAPNWAGYLVELAVGGEYDPTATAPYNPLINGGTVIAEDNSTKTIAMRTWETSTVTYSPPQEPETTLAGLPLQIRLRAIDPPVGGDPNRTYACWDDIKLTKEIVGPVSAGDDMITWSGEPVQLAPTFEDFTPATFRWTAVPADGVVFSDPNAEAPMVTITKATSNPSTVGLKLSVDGGAGNNAAYMTIDVYDDACTAARIGQNLAKDNPADFYTNCNTDMEDLQLIAGKWLNLTAPTSNVSFGGPPTPMAVSSTITGVEGGNDSWNTATNWSNGVPIGAMDAVIPGIRVKVDNDATPVYYGTLTLESAEDPNRSILDLVVSAGSGSNNALGAGINMGTGSLITINGEYDWVFPPINMEGHATIENLFGASDWNHTYFNGAIVGPNSLTLDAFNGHQYHFAASNRFDGLIADGQNDRYVVHGDAAGAFGIGDVTVVSAEGGDDRSCVIAINVDNVMADTATLYLNGKGWDGSAGGQSGARGGTSHVLEMNANDTISGLVVDGVVMDEGDYTEASGDWIIGTGTLTVAAADDTLPGVVIDNFNMATWSGMEVALSATATPGTGATGVDVAWSADPVDGVVFGDPASANTTVTITKATDNPSTVTLTLTATNTGGGSATPIAKSISIDVYDDACSMGLALNMTTLDQTDIDGSCNTNLVDFAVLTAGWINDYIATAPVAKP